MVHIDDKKNIWKRINLPIRTKRTRRTAMMRMKTVLSEKWLVCEFSPTGLSHTVILERLITGKPQKASEVNHTHI